MTWGRARATRSSSQTWTSTRSRIWCGMSTVAGEKCESTFYCLISLAVGWATSQTSLTFFWVLLTSMTSGVNTRSQLEFSAWRTIILLLLSDLWMFPDQRFKGGMLPFIVGKPCCWPGYSVLSSCCNCQSNRFLLHRWLTFWFSLTCTRLWSWKPQQYHFFLLTKRRCSANLTGR